MKKLRDKVLEVAKIAQECPENLQQTCFEILLKHALGKGEAPPTPPADISATVSDKEKVAPKSVVEEAAKKQDDLSEADIHVKARRFLEKYGLTTAELNQLFYKEGDNILPLYDDLKTTRTSESQIRVTLLQCLLSALKTGDFQTTVEAVREEVQTRKAYDSGNWGNNYKNNAGLFDFDKYSKAVKDIALSEQGKKDLSDVIKELQ